MAARTFNDVDSYIASFPEATAGVLSELRELIRSVIPQAEEAISYQLPTFRQQGSYVIYFGGYSKHVSVYPAPIEHPAFKDELAPYASGKGTAKFPLSKPLPAELIGRIVRHNAEANAARGASKAGGRR
jgi:uncharacterized protein YdhG (YjbR/CyaY superfamily)